jgi:hypothetical protein
VTEFRFAEILARVEALAPVALTTGANLIATASDAQVPKDTKALVNSRQIEVDEHQAAISYNTSYAHKQHEDLTYNHPHGGNAKYLENPMHSEAEAVFEIIAGVMREAF